ncbi:MAG: hypothetical protein QOG36_571 [Actinomycetota bacterium]|jgi:hypothetical protein|nr:hypothetical protein [Actinomycetota bacterium]
MSPKATFQWKEQRPLQSQARRVHPGQAHARVPAIPRTRSRCLEQMRPCWGREPQGFRQLAGQTHPLGAQLALPPIVRGRNRHMS